MRATQVAILVFIAVVAVGPLYTAKGYSPVAHVISALAAQNTPHNYLMSLGFVTLGAAVIYDGVRAFHPALFPFMLFGLAFGAAGLFGHRPISEAVPYSMRVAATHSALASLSGIALTAGFVWQAILSHTTTSMLFSAALACVCVVLPILMYKLPKIQGLIQRLMYLLVFAWLWVYYPVNLLA